MVRGTTAQFKFVLPYDYSELESARVVFWQPGNNGTTDSPLPIYKLLSQCSPTNNPKELSVTYSPSETLRFSEKLKARIQLSATTKEETRFASKVKLVTVYPIYDGSTLPDDIVPPSDMDNSGWIIFDGETVG